MGWRDGMPRNTLRAVAVQLQAVPAANVHHAEPPIVALKDSKGRAALPSVPYTEELPGTRDVKVSAAEVAFFKENGFLVKRGLVDGDALCAVFKPCAPLQPCGQLSVTRDVEQGRGAGPRF